MTMGVLLLQLSGPLQSWGDSSRFTTRGTRREPTKSGVVGLLAAALGRTRDESVEDLASLEMGVRVDQPGRILRDFQTEHSMDGKTTMPLTNRFYLADAKFLVVLGGPDNLLVGVAEALKNPRWPLYLGRRSCPPDRPVFLRVGKGDKFDIRDVLRQEPWLASKRLRKGDPFPDLEVACDARDGEQCVSQADYPVSFGAERKYACRPVWRSRISNPDNPCVTSSSDESKDGASSEKSGSSTIFDHDPMGFF